MKSQIILVSPITQYSEAAQTGLPILRFGLGLNPDGTLIRTLAQNRASNDILCLSDFGVSSPISTSTVRQLIDEAQYSGGILADIERMTPELDGFIQELDAACAEIGLPLFLPIQRIACAPHACALAPSAASGGCLRDELEKGMLARNGRLAVTFEPTRRRFLLPSSDPNGEELAHEELAQLRTRTGAHVFFSRELCANYFTYMDGDTGVFVLFDTLETMRARLQLIQDIGVPHIFVSWDGCKELFNQS